MDCLGDRGCCDVIISMTNLRLSWWFLMTKFRSVDRVLRLNYSDGTRKIRVD